MEIKKALEPTGKAYDGGDDYVAEEELILYWYNQRTNKRCGPVGYRAISSDRWEPYHEKKEIRPENAGELWGNKELGLYYHTDTNSHGDIVSLGYNGRAFDSLIHNQNGWKRLHPPVEDESVERVVIEGVKWSDKMEETGGLDDYTGIIWMAKPYSELRKLELSKRVPMKMILEIPRD